MSLNSGDHSPPGQERTVRESDPQRVGPSSASWIFAAVWVAVPFLVVGAGWLVLLFAFTAPSCLNTYLTSALSPDGRLKAVLFTQNCGATATLDTDLVVLPSDSRTLPPSGNAVLKDQSGRQYLALGGPDVRLVWRDRHTLEIRCGVSPLVDGAASAAGVALAVGSACLALTP